METSTKELNQPLVSILMLTYNRAHFIKEAVSSVISQTYQNWELVIIDDGSTDNTASIVSEFSDIKIKYIQHQENAGLFKRRSESLEYVNGKYTAVLDSDDFWTDKNKIQEQVNFLEENGIHVIVGTQTRLIDFNGNNIKKINYQTSDTGIRNIILTKNQFTHSSVLIRTESLKKVAGYQPTLAEDFDLFLQLGTIGKFSNLDKFYTAHRVHDVSENDHGPKMAKAVYSIVLKHRNEYPGSIRGLLVSKLRTLIYSVKSKWPILCRL